MSDEFIRRWFQEVDAFNTQHGRPFQDLSNQYDKDAVDIAKLLIQSLLLLHGGALIAIPTFVAIRPGICKYALVALLLCFCFGLISALVAALFAFFALAERSDAQSAFAAAINDRAWARVARLEHLRTQNVFFKNGEAESNAAADAKDKVAQGNLQRFARLRVWGVVLVCGSIASLIIASAIAAASL